jgi:ankyrin repeat domain-containing protein 50
MADPLSVAGSVAGLISLGVQVTQSLVEFYKACKGQKSNDTSTTNKLEHLLTLLENLRGQLLARTFRADERSFLQAIESSIHACDSCIGELNTENDKFKTTPHSADTFRAIARTAAYRLAYPFRQSTLQKLDEHIEEIVAHLSVALQLLQQKGIDNLQDNVENTVALLDLVRADQISSKIRNWLQSPDTSVEYNKTCRKSHPSTGLWFVNGPSFSSWLKRPNSFLWLFGFSGCGKSVLSSTAIQHAFQHRNHDPLVGIAFFFFVFDDDAKQDASAMLRALILQLSSQRGDDYRLLSELRDSHPDAIPPNEALIRCLRQLIRAFKDVYIVLDALDESPRGEHRGDILQVLADMRIWSESGLHLLVTSRDEVDIRESLYNDARVSQERNDLDEEQFS